MKNNIKNILIVCIFALPLIFISCEENHNDGDGHNHQKISTEHSDNDGHNHGNDHEKHNEEDGHNHGENKDNDEHHEEGLHLTKKQIESIGLQFGSSSSIKINDYVKASGTLGVPPNAYVSVSVKSEGIITGTKRLVEGNYIKKGALIAYLENTNFIIKQQEYLEAKAQLKLKQLDLDRQQALVDANAGVSKYLQNAQAEVAILEARSEGLSKQLSYLGISTANLTPQSISNRIAIIAPMSGYISNINIHDGTYAQPRISLMEIISDDHLHLELDVFEKDIADIKTGQKINYSVPALGTTIYKGKVSVIGKEFDTKTKTVRVHGHLEGKKPLFLKDLFINAKIWLNDNTATAVPEKSIIKDGENTFVYVAVNNNDAEETEFKAISVIPGPTSNGFTSVKFLDEIPTGMQIVTKGAYYVYAQSKVGELEHEH